MAINMTHCMFGNTSIAMQEIIDKMYEDDFNPNKLSNYEKKAYESLQDQCETMKSILEDLEYTDWSDNDE